MKVNLTVSNPIDLGEGVFKTELTHPRLDGVLSIVHGAKNRDVALDDIGISLTDDINVVVGMISQLRGKK